MFTALAGIITYRAAARFLMRLAILFRLFGRAEYLAATARQDVIRGS
jgi:hypothetical protein